jgi:hypothetical protein
MADQRATLDHQRSTTGLAFLSTKSIVQQADDGSVDEHQRLLAVRHAWFTKAEGADFPKSGSMPPLLPSRETMRGLPEPAR